MADKDRKHYEPTDPEKKRISSGDHSGKGRPRRDDDEQRSDRDLDEMGTHGGPKREASSHFRIDDLIIPPGR